MAVTQNREGHVAIIVTAREYQALASASVLMAENTGWSGDEANDRRDLRAINTLASKCRDAGIRTTVPDPVSV